MPRKPWQIPLIYNEDRWPDPEPSALPNHLLGVPIGRTPDDTDDVTKDASEDDTKDASEVEEILRREDRPDRVYECNDTTPIDYNKGPHDDEFGVADKDEPDVTAEEFNLDDAEAQRSASRSDDEGENALEPAENLYPDEQDD